MSKNHSSVLQIKNIPGNLNTCHRSSQCPTFLPPTADHPLLTGHPLEINPLLDYVTSTAVNIWGKKRQYILLANNKGYGREVTLKQDEHVSFTYKYLKALSTLWFVV